MLTTKSSKYDDDLNYKQINKLEKENSLKKDYKNIALLLFLYFLQGLPLGLTGSLPYILSSKKVSYADQGTFSFAFWPFSIKLLWAPLVDAIYIKRFGLRKSWLIPLQYLIGIFMFTFSDYVQELLDSSANNTDLTKNIYILTAIFFMFTFLAATQDIVIDGWALTMLSKENVAWSSTCNSVGQSAGWFLGNVVFLILQSHEFSNRYVRSVLGFEFNDHGIVTFKSFMVFFGFVFIISTTLIMIFKKETSHEEADESKVLVDVENDNEEEISENESVLNTYKLMWRITKIPAIRKFMVIQLTIGIAFAAESMAFLKLIEFGVPTENLGLLAVPLAPLQIILPLLMSKYSNGPEPLKFYVKAIPGRLIMSVISCIFVYSTLYFEDSNKNFSIIFYLLLIFISAVHSIFGYAMSVSQVSFYAKISDKRIGGTYMTFLNTISNLGGEWPYTAALYLASFITTKYCYFDAESFKSNTNYTIRNVTTILLTIEKNFCKSTEDINECVKLGAECVTSIDAYYVLTILCTIYGVLWLAWKKSLIYRLEKMPKSVWAITKNRNTKEN